MPLSKRRRLFTPKRKIKQMNYKSLGEQTADNEVTTARGRLKGALLEIMEPLADESDTSSDYTPAKRERNISQELRNQSSEEEDKLYRRKSPQRQSYVLKLFDRSVDLSQFNEDSPLYPICRAWIANQPKANYSDFRKLPEDPVLAEDSIDLPGPEGPVISRIPNLLPEQIACNKDNINLNYREAPPPSKEQLLHSHMFRWASVRSAWLEQAALVESRYAETQLALNKINANTLQ